MKNSKRKNFKGKKLATKLKKTYNFNLVRLKKIYIYNFKIVNKKN